MNVDIVILLKPQKTLLTAAALPPIFWYFACHHAVYLINRLPTPLLQHQSPYQALFDQSPDYHSLRSFGCLSYPWIGPYTTHKLDPRSTSCVYLGISLTHHCHICFDPIKSKIYLSRDVVFVEHEFPYLNRFKHLSDHPAKLQWDLNPAHPRTDRDTFTPQPPMLPPPLRVIAASPEPVISQAPLASCAPPASSNSSGTSLTLSLPHTDLLPASPHVSPPISHPHSPSLVLSPLHQSQPLLQ